MVIGNTWAISHDPERYPDPDKFDPDRFVNHTKGMKHFLAFLLYLSYFEEGCD